MAVGSSIWLLMVAIVILNTVAQGFLKAGAGRGTLLNASLFWGVVAYGASTLLYVLVLGKTRLSFAYPVVIGSTAIATCIVGMMLLNERISPLQWLGIFLVVAGIVCVAAARQRVH